MKQRLDGSHWSNGPQKEESEKTLEISSQENMIDKKSEFEKPVEIPKVVEEKPVNKKKFYLKIKKELPESPSVNDLVVWCIMKKKISIDQLAYAELPEALQALFEEK